MSSVFSSIFKTRRASATPSPTAPPADTSSSSAAPPSYEDAMATDSNASAPAPSSSNSSQRCLDLVFCVDCTGSMGGYISSAQQSMRDIVQKIVAAESVDIQCAIVSYRDWCDESSTYVVKVYQFASSLKQIQSNINELSANGGGDAPEAVTAGLAEVNALSFRKNSVRFCILIADAADHGLGEAGDSLPNGDPKGRDPLKLARELKDKNVCIYSVACEPTLSNTKFGRDFFFTLARITGGRFLPLTSASLLADVVIGGAKEELSLQALEQSIANEAEQVKQRAAKDKETISESTVAERVAKNLAARGGKTHQVRFDGAYEHQDLSNVGVMEEAESLAAARGKMKACSWGELKLADGSVPGGAKSSGMLSKTKSRSKKDKEEAKEEEEFAGSVSSSSSSRSSLAMACPAPSAPISQKVYSDYAAVSSEQVSRMLNKKK